MFLLFSFIDLLRGVAILDNNHMVVAGNIIVRSMFELLIDFLYCETDRKNLYLRFGEYQDINRVLLYNSVSSDIQEKVDKDKYENVTLKNYNLFLEKYNINPKDKRKLSNWCGLSIKERVDNVSETVPEIYNLYLNNEMIRVTPYHRFYVLRNKNYEWVTAKDLKLTDKLFDINKKYIKINKIEYIKENNTVYNFEVANNHTYFVSENNILVHNAKVC